MNGSYAYIADGHMGLAIADISDPASPVLVGYCKTDGVIHNVSVSGSYVYATNYDAGLVIVDISDPANPVRVYEEGTYWSVF